MGFIVFWFKFTWNMFFSEENLSSYKVGINHARK